ncbi:TPR domain protein [Nitzschia inconspicua]|uniref:Fucosyltransferase n=1 Tax=Nitzschia inconspicua TaxID=303405 RepID=A0A9K3Q1I5_9STRA|nr:TPR domain protein [Nitzschia inconspicua]KAG7367090.1 TPR domain protein [Nitzschia inconspicua]
MPKTFLLSLPKVLLIFLIVQLATLHWLHYHVLETDTTNIIVVEAGRQKDKPWKSFFSNFEIRERNVDVFNPWNREKFMCGTIIAPNSTTTLVLGGADCPEETSFSRVFRTDPTINTKDVPPIVIHFLDKANKNQPHDVQCDVPCAVWPTGNPTVRDPAKIDGTPFQFAAYSMEGSGIYKALEIDPKAYQKYKYYATTSFQSEVPLSYYSPSMYNIRHPPVNFETAIKGASFIARNCNSFSGREALLRDLIKQASSTDFRIESLSACMRNALPPNGVNLNNKTEVMRSYLFHFSFENQKTPDYVTEKLWGALESGTLPVYFGAPNIREHVPPRSIIMVEDFTSTKELVSYLIQLSTDERLYNKYHEWRKQPLPQSFRDKYDFTEVHSYCRVCRFSFAMKYGYGWDHHRQQVKPSALLRGETCLDEKGWMASPMREIWIHDNKRITSDEQKSERNCALNKKRSASIPGTNWKRTIWDHDLVTDIEINRKRVTGNTENLLWQLQLLSNTTTVNHRQPNQKSEYDIFWIQDHTSRVIVVFNETVDWTDKPQSLFQVRIHKSLRARFIVEEIDRFHQNGAETQSYFASFMIDEFLHPLVVS